MNHCGWLYNTFPVEMEFYLIAQAGNELFANIPGNLHSLASQMLGLYGMSHHTKQNFNLKDKNYWIIFSFPSPFIYSSSLPSFLPTSLCWGVCVYVHLRVPKFPCTWAWVLHVYTPVYIEVTRQLARVDFISFNMCLQCWTQIDSVVGQSLYHRATPLALNFNFMNNILFRKEFVLKYCHHALLYFIMHIFILRPYIAREFHTLVWNVIRFHPYP